MEKIEHLSPTVHRLSESKFGFLGTVYELQDFTPPTPETLRQVQATDLASSILYAGVGMAIVIGSFAGALALPALVLFTIFWALGSLALPLSWGIHRAGGGDGLGVKA